MRLRGQIAGLRSELNQANLSLELLNDILKSKGDHSQNSFVTDLVRRIDRLLNPEKYFNSTRVEPRATIAFNDTGSLLIDTIVVSPTEADGKGAEGVYATIRNDYARDENGRPIFNRVFGFRMWGVGLKGRLPSETTGFTSASDAKDAALRIYKLLRY